MALIITPGVRLAPSLLITAGKADRLRQAKIEADKEIAAYKAEREGAYQKKVAEVCDGRAQREGFVPQKA